MEVMQTKVEIMQDEQSHRRKVEMALAARSTVSPKLMGEQRYHDPFTTVK